MAGKSEVKSLVAPQVDKNGKSWWKQLGIGGMKENGDVWVQFDLMPTHGWDGYAMLVDRKENRNAQPSKEAKPSREAPDERATGGGADGDEVPF